MATSVPALQFTPTGLVLPNESEIVAGVLTDIDVAFGGGLNKALETPQGQLASTTAAVIGNKNNEIASIVAQVDPNFADGRMQDAIGHIYFLDRKPGTPTSVVATCTGLAGTMIPVGTRAQSTDGTIYICVQAGVILPSGSTDLSFSATVNGPIACPADSLTRIYQAIPGWDSINNPLPGTVGSLIESRAEFEAHRRASVALNARGSLPSIYANVLNVDGVIDAYVAENVEDIAVTIGGVSLLPHSIYVAAVGGAVADIARAIWAKKSDGANYNGNTSFTVTDESGYSYPYPQYVVKYQIPAALPLKYAVQLANNPSLPSNIIALVKAAIVAAFNGTDGGQRARIGATIYASRYYAPIAQLGASVSILSLMLGPTTATLPSYTVPIDRRPTIAEADITVTLV